MKGTKTSYLLKGTPSALLVLGAGFVMASSHDIRAALGMGAAVLVALLLSSIVISALHKIIPAYAKLPAYLMIITGFVSLIAMVMEAFFPVGYCVDFDCSSRLLAAGSTAESCESRKSFAFHQCGSGIGSFTFLWTRCTDGLSGYGSDCLSVTFPPSIFSGEGRREKEKKVLTVSVNCGGSGGGGLYLRPDYP